MSLSWLTKANKIKATRETSKRFEEISASSKALPGNRVHEIKELNPQRKHVMTMIALDAGAEDLKAEDDAFEIWTDPNEFSAVREAPERMLRRFCMVEAVLRVNVRSLYSS